jgi:hypothetical protein
VLVLKADFGNSSCNVLKEIFKWDTVILPVISILPALKEGNESEGKGKAKPERSGPKTGGVMKASMLARFPNPQVELIINRTKLFATCLFKEARVNGNLPV